MGRVPEADITVEDLAADRRATEREMVGWIVAYREAGGEPRAMLKSALAAFPGATGSMFAVALVRANRARAR